MFNPYDVKNMDPVLKINPYNSLIYNTLSNVYISGQAIKLMMEDVNNCPYTYLVSDENWLKFCESFNDCVVAYGSIYEELHYFRMKLNRTPESFVELYTNKNDWYIYTKEHTAYHMNNGFFESSDESAYPSYSTYSNEYNMKFVDKYGMNEVVVTPKIDVSNMEEMERYNYLISAENWLILTEDYEKAQNNPNFKYDPVNVGTYNYCGYEKDKDGNVIEFITHNGSIKSTSSAGHQNLDVKPYLNNGASDDENWGNIPCLIYGNTRDQRDDNYNFYTQNADCDIYDINWEGRF